MKYIGKIYFICVQVSFYFGKCCQYHQSLYGFVQSSLPSIWHEWIVIQYYSWVKRTGFVGGGLGYWNRPLNKQISVLPGKTLVKIWKHYLYIFFHCFVKALITLSGSLRFRPLVQCGNGIRGCVDWKIQMSNSSAICNDASFVIPLELDWIKS